MRFGGEMLFFTLNVLFACGFDHRISSGVFVG